MRARIIRAYIAKPKNIPLISLISQYTRPRDKRDKRGIFPLNSYIYARALLSSLYWSDVATNVAVNVVLEFARLSKFQQICVSPGRVT